MKLAGHLKTWLLVIILSVVLAITNSIGFFLGLLQQPADSVFLGTVHYWEDYFFYLNHFLQGKEGAWLVANRYTNEITPDSHLYWTNLLMGKMGGFIGLPPILIYNLSLILLAFTAITLSYLILSRIVFPKNNRMAFFAFLVTWFGASLINRVKSNEGPMIYWPYQIWKTPHFAFDRLGGAPHQIVITILFYGTLLSVIYAFQSKKNSARIKWNCLAIVFGIMLASIQPVQAGMLAGSICFALSLQSVLNRTFPKKTDLVIVSSLTLAVGLVMIYMTKLLSTEPHIQTKIWEAAQQSATTWPFLFLSLGPVMVILAALGILSRDKHLSLFDAVGIAMVVGGYFLFMFTFITSALDIANVRVLFPVSHIFWGVFAGYGAELIIRRLSNSGWSIQKSYFAIVGIFLLSVLPTIFWEISKKTEFLKNRNDLMVYMPKSTLEAFETMLNKKPYSDTILANSTTHFDTLVPAFSGHTTYSGHILATTRNSEKQAESAAFFNRTWTANQGLSWLTEKNIRYILFTHFDGDRTLFESHYPFLKNTVFVNNEVVVYSLQ